MGTVAYVLVTLTSLLCAVLLLRGYVHLRKRLLLWSGICFVGMTISNVLLILDLVYIQGADLYRWRLGTAAVAMLFLVHGLVWESD
jgi:hypothetical protein